MPNEIHVSPTIKGASLNPQELFLFFPIRRNSDFQRFQRYVFRQDSDNRQMNDFRREQSHFQISISRSSSNPINSAENLKRPLPIQWERPFHDYFFKGLSQKSRRLRNWSEFGFIAGICPVSGQKRGFANASARCGRRKSPFCCLPRGRLQK